MKNLFFASTIFVALIIVLTRQANAQFVVSGSLGITTTADKIDGDKQWNSASFEVCPSVGYVFGDWEFGAMFEYTRSKTTLSVGDKRTETESAYAVGPYANYCFANVGKVFFSVEATSMFGFADDEHTVHLQHPDHGGSPVHSGTRRGRHQQDLLPGREPAGEGGQRIQL